MTAAKVQQANVPGTVRGILLQATRFLYYLLVANQDDVVSLELFEDVGVEHQDGSKTAEQDKSFLSSNPLTDRSLYFWKTFRHWTDAAQAGSMVPERSWFVLYAPQATMGPIVHAFHDATTTDDARYALEKAQQAIVDNDGLRIGVAVRGHVQAVFGADPNLVIGVIKRFKVDAHAKPEDALRPLLFEKLVGEDSFDDVVTWAQGWVKRKIDHFVELGQPPRVIRRDFHRALLNYVRLHDRTDILRSVAGTATAEEVAKELAMRDYVRQLKIIDVNDVEVLEAVSDFLSASVDRTTWSDQGMISEASLQSFEKELEWTWRNRRRQTLLGHVGKDATVLGQLTYANCMEHHAKMDDLETPKPFVRGSWHALADDLKIGWHPEYENVLGAPDAAAQ